MEHTLQFQPQYSIADATTFGTNTSERPPVIISVVIAAYNGAGCLSHLHQRLTAALSKIGVSYEIVFVEDRSTDNSWQIIVQLANSDPHVRAIRFSRNFGQQMAITAGLSKSRGEWIVVMDCDLQDPPEEIVRLYEKAKEGYDLVLARRAVRTHSTFRKTTNKIYHWLLSKGSGTDITGEYGSFSILSRKVAEAYLRFSETNRHYVLILLWLGFNWTSIDYSQSDRFSGDSSYNLRALIKHAITGWFFQTTFVLRSILMAGFMTSGVGLLLATYMIWSYFVHGAMAGWTSLAVLTLVLGGFILVCQGIVGLYIGEIFNEVKGRPLYIIANDYCIADFE